MRAGLLWLGGEWESEMPAIYAGFVDGAYVEGQGVMLRVENPSDGGLVAEFPGFSVAQSMAAVQAARRSFDNGPWAGMPMAARVQKLRVFADALGRRSEQLIALIVAETGCPRASSVM